MGRKFGFKEDFGRKVGKYSICTGCEVVMNLRGYVVMVDGRELTKSGRVRRRKLRVKA